MFSRLRLRLLAARRLGMLALALVFLVHPVLMVAAEMHAAGHSHEGGHAPHAVHAAPDSGAAPDPDGGELWHGLMHKLHCCGGFSLLPSLASTVLALPLPHAVPSGATPMLRSPALPQPLRPPIHG